jgi:hypothetical protein
MKRNAILKYGKAHSHLVFAPLLAALLAACGSQNGEPPPGETSGADTFDDAGAKAAVAVGAPGNAAVDPAGAVTVSTALAAAMNGSTSTVKARIFAAQPDVPDLPASIASGVVAEDGALTEATLDGAPATKDTFDAYTAQLQGRLAARYADIVAFRARAWTDLAARYGLRDELAGAIRSGASSVAVELPAATARALASDATGSVRAMSDLVDGVASNISLSTALGSMGLTSSAFPAGWTGSGTGIYLSDFGQPSTSGANADCVNTSRLAEASGTTGSIADHATLMVCLLQNAAPGAQVYYWTDYGTDGFNTPSDLLTRTPPIYVSSMSDNWDGNGAYTAGDADFDDRIVNTRVAHFNSTGNAGSYVASPSVAYNVIAVGNWNSATNTIDPGSDYIDPATGAHKPEVVAPGVGINVSNYFQGTGGTSVATPLAAAFADDLMQEFSFLRYQPALLKAYLMVNGIRVNTDGTVWGDKDGSGHPDFATAQYGAWITGNGTSAQVFTKDSNGDGHKDITFTVGLNAGWNYNSVMSFLVNGDYVLAHGVPNMDLDLYVVSPSGSVVASSTSSNQSFESVRFTAPVTGTYTVRIEQYAYSGTGTVSLGAVVRGR